MEYERQSRGDRQQASAGNEVFGASISGPVGKRWGENNVTNLNADQRTIISLLAAISVKDGGKKEVWTVPPLAGPSGQCPESLKKAIWEFQTWWKALGVFRNIDNVVDPGGNTLKHMNSLLAGQGGGRSTPVDPSPPKIGPGFLQPMFSRMIPRPTNWKIEGTGTLSLSAGEYGLAAGKMTVSNTLNRGSRVPLIMAGGGLSLGPLPAGYEVAPSDFPSLGSQIHAGPRTPTTTLALEELLGMCLLIGVSAGAVGGGNATAILFNIGINRSLRTLPVDLFNSLGGPSGFLVDAINTCRAFGSTVGTFYGISVGVSVIEVILRREGSPDIRPDPDVRIR